MTSPTVSVVIPTYNRSQLTARAVLSAALQTQPPQQIIVVDDCSTDETPTTVERIIQHRGQLYPMSVEITLLRQPRNAGANAARNAGIRAATSRFVAFLDSDDLWHPEKLKTQIREIEKRLPNAWQPIFSFTGRFRVDDDYKLIARQFPHSADVARQILRSNIIGTLSSIIIDRQLLLFCGLFDENLRACQDWDLYVRAVPLADCVGVAAPLTLYFDGRIDRITRSSRTRLLSHIEIYKRYLRERLARPLRREFYRNIAEDLAQMGKTRLAKEFHMESLVSRRRPRVLAWAIAEASAGRIQELRNLSYARSRRRMDRVPALRTENARVSEEYRAFIGAIDDAIARLGEIAR